MTPELLYCMQDLTFALLGLLGCCVEGRLMYGGSQDRGNSNNYLFTVTSPQCSLLAGCSWF